MTAGRCEGCGAINNSCTVTRNHVRSCPKFVELYRRDPALALDPEESFRRHQEETRDPHKRAEARSIKLTKMFANVDERRVSEATRWEKKDLLA